MNLKLLIAFLVLPFCGKGQIIIKDSIGVDRMPNPYSLQLMTAPQVNDTVKCIMLVCDTSHRYYYTYFQMDSIQPKNSFVIKGHYIKQDNGFANQLLYYQIGYAYTFDRVNYKYLDEDKNPLPKNIIVWMSINTEQ
jgi:hypothetical protein